MYVSVIDLLPTSHMSATHFLDQLISLISSMPSTTCPCLSGQSINHYGYKSALFCPCSMKKARMSPHIVTSHTHRKWGQGAWWLRNVPWLWTNKHFHAHTLMSTNRKECASKQVAKMKAVVGNALTWFWTKRCQSPSKLSVFPSLLLTVK